MNDGTQKQYESCFVSHPKVTTHPLGNNMIPESVICLGIKR